MATFADDAKLREALGGRKIVKRYEFPGSPGTFVGIRMLSDTELDGCRIRAQEHIKMKRVELALDPEFFDTCLRREIVAAAFRDPDSHDVFYFSKADEVGSLDSITSRALYELYMTHHHAMDPYAHASEEEVAKLVEELGKSETAAAGLSLYDAVSLRSFVLSLALKLRETQQQLKSVTG